MSSYPQEAQNGKTPKRPSEVRTKYPGFYPCFWHDVLSELLKEQPSTLCRKCYSNLLRHHVQLTAQNLIQIELIRRHLNEIDNDIKRINDVQRHSEKKEDQP